MFKVCEADGCNRPVYGLGKRGSDESITRFCRKHYTWLKQRGSTEPTKFSQGTLEERFWRKVKKAGDDECWIWQGGKNSKGYGVIALPQKSTNVKGGSLLAHRLSYQIATGEDLKTADVVCHSCDNPPCVNPKHLRKDTTSGNIKEAFDKGRKTATVRTGEDNAKSKLTLEQVRFIRANPQLGHKAIADMFGLSPNCIRGVRIGRTWKGIE